MKTKSIIYVMLTASLLFLGSCNDKLDIAEHGCAVLRHILSDRCRCRIGCDLIYITMRGLEYNYKMLLNLLSDDFWAGGGARTDNADLNGVNRVYLRLQSDLYQSCFTSFYQMVYGANVALNHIKGRYRLSETDACRGSTCCVHGLTSNLYRSGAIPIGRPWTRFHRIQPA